MDTVYIGKEQRCSRCNRIIYTQSAFFKINNKIFCVMCAAVLDKLKPVIKDDS